MNPLALLELVPRWVLAALVAALAVLAIVNQAQIDNTRTALATEKADHAADNLAATEAAAKQLASNLAESERRAAAQKEIDDAALKERASADADHAAQLSAADRLLQRAKAHAAGGCASPSNPQAVEPGAPAEPAPDLLADMQRRVVEAAGQLADFATSAHLAGLVCQREYDALTPEVPADGGH